MSDDLTSSVRQWLETSGRALEMRVERTLRQTGRAKVQPAFSYVDTVTGAAREGDVVADFPWIGMNRVRCSLVLAVECKSSTKHPWVGFFSDSNPRPRGDLTEWATFAHGPFVGITEPLPGLWAGRYPFTPTPAASHLATARSGENNFAGDAVRQVLSCAAAVRHTYLHSQSAYQEGLVCLAAVVTAAPLLTCRLDDDGSVVLDQVEEFDVWGYGTDGERHRVLVRSEASLPRLADALGARAAEADQ